jgi:hypothetical protein
MKKKVRFAIGAIGAVSALGLVAPAANAAPVATHAQKTGTRSVALIGATRGPSAVHPESVTKGASANNLHGEMTYSGRTILAEQAYIKVQKSGLTERARYYNAAGTMIHSSRHGGTQEGGKTVFDGTPNVGGVYQACFALVLNNTSTVKYGPVCLDT